VLTRTLNEKTSITTRVKDSSHGPLEHKPTPKDSIGEASNSDAIANTKDSEWMESTRTRRSSSHRTVASSLVRELPMQSNLFNLGTKMFGHNAREARSIFGKGLLKTFGKLSQPDIDQIDGRHERLIAELVEQYGGTENFAKQKTEAFELKLSVNAATITNELPAGVGS
jgi:uncharacterized protein YjbJ (UPF0337 family)